MSMNNLSYSGPIAPSAAEDVEAGDLVRTGANDFPRYEVVAVRGDKAWVREVQTGAEQIILRSRCRRVSPSTH